MTSTLQKTQREAKIDGHIKNCAGKQFATPPHQQLDLGLAMVCVSTVSIVYNLRMDHYGVRKCINSGDTSFPHILFFLTSLKSNQSNFQLHWSKRKVVSSIQTKNPLLDLLTTVYIYHMDIIRNSIIHQNVQHFSKISKLWICKLTKI